MTEPASRLEVGQEFPELVLPSLGDGSPWSLRALRGTKTLLAAFASW